ncbi:unnamed protein product [Bodo saltans]|uniref:Uncharacterized protein n=1 Tax=Bodo saltans TaxID=75058 RepID=A0A0S4KH79_BODSA|nr:unnamed protein product [Bodo saltans]|eukprot:CUI14992.1 unnamed protein product [Bodo saltans]
MKKRPRPHDTLTAKSTTPMAVVIERVKTTGHTYWESVSGWYDTLVVVCSHVVMQNDVSSNNQLIVSSSLYHLIVKNTKKPNRQQR